MTTGYQITDQNAMHFITPTIVDWVDVFTRQTYRDIVINSIKYCITEKGLLVYGYVIMSNHMHLIIRSTTGNLSGTIGDLKKFTSRRITDAIKDNGESRREWMLHRFAWNARQNASSVDYQVWTHDNGPELIYTRDFFDQKLNYIHQNPVRAGLVVQPEDYIYSSAKTVLTGAVGLLPVVDWYT